MAFKNKQKQKDYQHKWYLKNIERLKEAHKEWRNNNKEKKKEINRKWYERNRKRARQQDKIWKQQNLDKFNASQRKWRKKRRKVEIRWKLNCNLSTSINICLKSKKAGRHWETLVGYTLEDLMKHLEIRFKSGMTWNNYGPYWVIDHIKPKSLFKYNSPEDKEFKECWSLKNLQPLEKMANIKKGNYY